jgi:folate-binding protein YgfZ
MSTSDIYKAAQESAVWRDMSNFGRFTCSGSDAATLLHHLTTNDIKGLKLGAGRDAALVTNKARLLDWLTIYRLEDRFVVLTSPNRRDLFAPHAQKFVLFRQQIEIIDITDSSVLFGLFGPGVATVLTKLGADAESVLRRPLNELQSCTVDGVGLMISRTSRLPGGGVLVGGEDAAGLRRLVQSSGFAQCDNETYNVLRVEAGLPVTGLELTEEVNPWEARLDDLISLHKGCYNGQEVVARLNTYKKVKQRLSGLKLEQPMPMGQPHKLQVDGRDAGFITSSVMSPRFGPIALAYVRGDYQEQGQQVEVLGAAETAEQTATVVDLPFAG